ncbi:MAG: fatty acid hydroxylase [Rickettsiales bacterium]|nr:fatty acid hydroxylase [Rickettsiales bacterium]|tara:strand:+ start:188 stop:880 length:693 start_codon:yes stop_codon:yes gene_type:complete
MKEPQEALAQPADTPNQLGKALTIFFGHASPRLLSLVLLGCIALRFYAGPFSTVDLLITAGIVLVWPMVEWLVHVHLLHFRPRRVLGVRIDPLNARRHRAHHRDPWRFERAFIPIPGLLLALSKLMMMAALSPWPASWSAVVTVLILGLHYEWVHYLAHIRYCPSWGPYRRLVRSHRLHHFKNETNWLGVSMTSGDVVMGTAPQPETVPRSPTVRDLHPEVLPAGALQLP